MTRILLTAICLLLLGACGGDDTPATSNEAPPAASASISADDTNGAAILGDWGVETQYIDDSVDPGDDFYRYVNGGWLDTTELPPGFPLYGSFGAVQIETEEQIDAIIEDILANDWPNGSPQSEIKALYESYMDTERLNELGVEALRPELDMILAAKSHADIARTMIASFNPGFPKFSVTIDDGNPERYILLTGQSGTSLPREYYVTDSEPYATHLAGYQAYLAKLLTLAGIDEPEQRAASTVALEKQLAEASWTATEKRNKVGNYHLMSFAELEDYAPGAEWSARAEAAGFGERNAIIVNQDSAVQAQAKIFADTPVEVLQSYMLAHLLNSQAQHLSSAFDDAQFDYYSRTLQGIDEQRPRKARALALLGEHYGEPLGKLYVERYFPESSKKQVEKMVEYMQAALRKRLAGLDWMDEETRAEAINKLDNFSVNIGYPDRWKDLSALDFEPDDLIGNLRQIAAHDAEDKRTRLDMPLQRWEWFTEPQVINAFYAGVMNSITFPAAILQPPFFDPNADPAVNFGSVAAVIGHEIGHGFDDQGSQSDGKGVLRNWWSDDARAEFESRAARLGEQYGQYSMVDGANLNGQLTMGENLGDLAGINVAYAAFKAYEKENYPDGAPVIDGFTGDQRFFLAYAQLWRDIATDMIWQRLALTDGHSPGRFRTNGIVRNFDPWYDAFDVGPDNALYLPPDERVRIW